MPIKKYRKEQWTSMFSYEMKCKTIIFLRSCPGVIQVVQNTWSEDGYKDVILQINSNTNSWGYLYIYIYIYITLLYIDRWQHLQYPLNKTGPTRKRMSRILLRFIHLHFQFQSKDRCEKWRCKHIDDKKNIVNKNREIK